MTPDEGHRIMERVEDIDRRVIVLEARSKSNEAALSNISDSVVGVSNTVSLIRDTLGDHVLQEEKDRSRFYYGIVLTLLAAVGTLVTVLVQHLLGVQG